MPATHIVEDDDLLVLRRQQFNRHAADVTRTARDEYGHGRLSYLTCG
jgi:hypothetical protein